MAIPVSGDAIVRAGSSLNADGQGFLTGTGPGAGSAYTLGGTYGGRSPINPLPTYGSASNPLCLGSGGGNSAGGGAIKLVVADTLTVNGTLSANGGTASGKGGSAGGSLWIDTGALAGTGRIQANGGVGTYGGGGGRIASNTDRRDLSG